MSEYCNNFFCAALKDKKKHKRSAELFSSYCFLYFTTKCSVINKKEKINFNQTKIEREIVNKILFMN